MGNIFTKYYSDETFKVMHNGKPLTASCNFMGYVELDFSEKGDRDTPPSTCYHYVEADGLEVVEVLDETQEPVELSQEDLEAIKEEVNEQLEFFVGDDFADFDFLGCL